MPESIGNHLFNLGSIPVFYLDKGRDLPDIAGHLQRVSSLAFDTEFDRFRHAYGFSLYLLQIFDGSACYLIDALSIQDLSPLYPVFSNKAILKILYSGKEDVDLLRRRGCPVLNLFDVQAASRICNHEATSFARLVAAETGIDLNKSQQTSNWRQRPLTRAQLEYAAQDVIPLPGLMEKFQAEVAKLGRLDILQEENEAAQFVTTGDNVPRLSPGQKARLSPYHQEILLRLVEIRDRAAQKLNQPPFKIVGDDLLERMVTEPEPFLNQPFEKGFSRRALGLPGFRDSILRLLRSMDPAISTEPEKEKKSKEEWAKIKAGKDRHENWFRPIRNEICQKYGAIAGEFFMVGVRDLVCSPDPEPGKLKKYQRQMLIEAAQTLQLEWPAGW